MTIREYHLALQGFERQQENVSRREAGWVAMILNSQYVEAEITPEELLGEEPPERDEKQELKDAEKRLEKLQARRQKAGK
jgi:hypothetical protein